MEKTGLFYVRFMDDWIVLSPNRWKLKKAIQIVNQTLNELKVEKHPDKTFSCSSPTIERDTTYSVPCGC